MDPVTIGLALAATASLVGGGLSFMGSKEANSANANLNALQLKQQWDAMDWQKANDWLMLRTTQDYNAEQAQLSRNFYNWQGELSRQYNSAEAVAAREFNSSEAAKARQFSEYLSNTSYQRARRDMLAAGLNPILAYAQGGATSPPAASASGGAASVGSVGGSSASSGGYGGGPGVGGALHRMENALSPAVASALQSASAVMGVQQLAANIDQTRAQTSLAQAETARSDSQAALNRASTVTEAQRAGLVKGQRATEMVMPSLRQAQTSAQSAAAVESAERARTEPERRTTLVTEGARNVAQANLASVEAATTQNFGRGNVLPGISGSAVGNPILSAREYLQRILE